MLQFSEKLLNNLMQIGLTVSLAALVPLILRRLMKKRYPARMVCVVWAILALRLLVPVQLTLPQAPVQVMPRTNYVVQSNQTAFRQAGLPVAQNPARWVTGTQAQMLSAADTGTVKTVDITDILLTLWLAGVISCILWQGIGYYRLIRSLKGTSQPVERADLHTILQEQCADLVIDREIPLQVSAAGDNDKGLTKELRMQLAQKQANESENLGYTVKLDGKDTYLITDREFSDNPGETIPGRVVQKLTFAKQDGEWTVSNSEIVPENGRVTSLDEFKLLYENDLGLPDFVAVDYKKVSGNRDPVSAAEVLLGISPAASQVEGSDEESAPYNDIRKVTFTFKDNSKVVVTMVNQFGQGWLPQDWMDGSGVRSRTAADLAQQYARGVLHKSAQYIFPILTPDGQKDLITQQMAMTGGEQWTWKYGPSSPSATDFVLVPTDDEQDYTVVFRYTSSAPDDVRSAYTVQTIRENKNSSVIGYIRELSTDSMTQSELFRTYYATGLSWPTVPQYIDSMDTQMIRGYADPAQAAMQYFGMALHGDSYLMLVKDTEVIRQATGSFGEGDSNTETAVVQLTFGDSSAPVKVQLEKTAAGYWQPVGVVEDITAKSGEQELGIGANARGALITGKLPELAVGDTIKFTFANEPSGGVQLTNRLVNLDGTMQDALTDEQTALTKTADGWTYTVPESMSKSLTSTAVEPYLHALVLEYTDARHIQHKAAALYAMQNGEAATVVHGDETLNSVAYRNDVLDYTLELPLSFRNTVGIRQYEDGSVHFNMLDEADSSSAHDICIMTLNVDATAVLHSEYGENWTKNYPSPVKQLAEKDGLTYYLAYVSDVQYDPSNQEIAAKYKEMFTAAQNITAEDFVLDDLTDQDGTVRRAQLLTSLGAHYAVLHMGAQHDQPYQVAVNTNNNSCEVYVSRIDWTTEAQYKVYAADRVTFKDITNTEPTTVEHLADSTQGLTAEQFDLLYGTLDLPVYTDDELANLQRVLQKDQIPEQGAAFFLGLGDMYGIFDGDSVKIYGDNNEFASLTYQFTDPNTGKENGKYVKLTMHKAIADSSLPALWIPYNYELYTA